MARFARLKVLNKMIETGMVPVFYSGDIAVAKRVAASIFDGGCPFWSSPTGAITHGKSSANWSAIARRNCPT